jgi:hypothetical protein
VADDVVEHSVAVPRAEPEPLIKPRPAETPTVHRWRFAVAYLALALVAGTGIGAAMLLLQRPEEAQPPAWSDWRPVGRTTSYGAQIAEFVSAGYRGADGEPLTAAIAGPLTAAGLPVQAILIRHDPPIASGRREYELYGADTTVTYQLCGRPPLCSLEGGTMTEQQLLVLRRQALEFALYTFKYVAGADAALVLLPPDLAGTPEDRNDDRLTAVYFRKQELAPELARPLRATLPATGQPPSAARDEADAAAVARLTRRNIFDYQFDRLQNDAALLVLTPENARP